LGKPLQEVAHSVRVIKGKEQTSQSTKVIKLDGGRISIIDAIKTFLTDARNSFHFTVRSIINHSRRPGRRVSIIWRMKYNFDSDEPAVD
jgi:hypothetical protein